jgi:lysozyme
MAETLDPKLVAFVEKEEGFEPIAKWDYEQWSNGYGTKARYPHEPISRTEAQRRLDVELSAAVGAVERFKPGLPTGVLRALSDLTYNAGAGWMHAELGEAVKDEDWPTAEAHLMEYDRAGGRPNAGLRARRAAEDDWVKAAV